MSPDGTALVVTERASNQIVTYAIDDGGGLGDPVVNPSEGQPLPGDPSSVPASAVGLAGD